jgi:signal transduction histidine kinase
MGSRLSRQTAKGKAINNGHTHFLCMPPSSREAQSRSDQAQDGLQQQTITVLKHEVVGKLVSQQALQDAALQAVWEHSSMSVIVCNAEGRIIFTNAAAKQMARIEPEGMRLNSASSIWGTLVPSESKSGMTGWPQLKSLLARPTTVRECRLIQSGNRAYDVMFSSAPLATEGQTKAGAVLMFTDITAVKRREALLRERAISKERSRMAGDLHDTLCQGLNAIVLMLQAAEMSACQDKQALGKQLRRVYEVAKNTLQEARCSMWTFSRQAMGNVDPATSLALAAEELFNKTSIDCELSLQEQPFDLPSRIRFELLRIGKEALTNALKHSQATSVQVKLTYQEQSLELSVKDDGRGFVPASGSCGEHGYGLISMRQRAEGLGGKVAIESKPGQGTKVVVLIPLIREEKVTAMAA